MLSVSSAQLSRQNKYKNPQNGPFTHTTKEVTRQDTRLKIAPEKISTKAEGIQDRKTERKKKVRCR